MASCGWIGNWAFSEAVAEGCHCQPLVSSFIRIHLPLIQDSDLLRSVPIDSISSNPFESKPEMLAVHGLTGPLSAEYSRHAKPGAFRSMEYSVDG